MKSVKCIILIMCILCCSSVYSFESTLMQIKYKHSTNELRKPYADHVITNHEGVFLRIGDCWIVTEGFQATSEGMLVLIYGNWMTIEEALEIPECKRGTWECSRCHFVNYEGVSACAVCGKSRYA